MDHYSPLPSSISSSPPPPPPPSSRRRWSFMFFSLVTSAGLLLALLALLRSGGGGGGVRPLPPPKDRVPVDGAASRGPSHGVSEKSMGFLLGGTNTLSAFPWTNAMLQWQRTAFHFQPPKNWMNDPNAPVFYKGWYHLFYQYNPVSPVWGNISWGHAASRDLIHWLHLPVAMVPDRWYDANGVWTGSATTLPDGQLVILYTGSTNDTVQVQNLAVPEDPSDPLLLRWRKADEANPVLLPPPGVGPTDFRDPTTAWFDGDGGEWRFLIGTKDDRDHAGVAMIYKTKDFKAAELFTGLLHAVPGTGMWECVDFYPVGTDADDLGVDMPATSGKGVRHVLKASLDDDRHDYYAIGTYEKEKGMWVPDDAEADVGLGLRYDWGKFYASKTFYDQSKKRRVLWSWIGETDSELADIRKGWASLQGIPRTVLLDVKTGRNLLQWPVEEVKSLRTSMHEFTHLKLEPQTLLPLNVSSATQLDLEVELDVKPYNQTEAAEAVDVGYNCSTSDGAMQQGVLGPFGLLVLADAQLSEQTAVYFYVAKGADGSLKTHFCHDEMRSSKANDIYKRVVGNTVPVLDGEKLSLRILVDHSIVESFAQGGRTCITSRVYPTRAIYNSANVFIFNYATGAQVIFRSIKIWQMSSANINLYSLPA